MLGGKWPIDEKFPAKPANELHKIKIEAVPDASLIVVHPKKIISGDKKIPPPVPVKPDSKPMTPPRKRANKKLTF